MRPAPTLVRRRVVGDVRTVDLAAEALQPTVSPGAEIPLVTAPADAGIEEPPHGGFFQVSGRSLSELDP